MRQTIQFVKENYGGFAFNCKQYDQLYELMKHDKKNTSVSLTLRYWKKSETFVWTRRLIKIRYSKCSISIESACNDFYLQHIKKSSWRIRESSWRIKGVVLRSNIFSKNVFQHPLKHNTTKEYQWLRFRIALKNFADIQTRLLGTNLIITNK